MDWKELIGSIAPTLATCLGGPLVGLGVEAIGKAMGMNEPSVQKVKDALTQGQLTGDQIAQLKSAELALQTRMRELDIQEEALYASDRDSARRRQEAVKDRTPAVLAYFLTAGFFGVLGYLLVAGKPTVGGDALLVMLGSLGTGWAACIQYFYGSSSGSASKTATIDRLTAK
jgi:hypothetical protein